MLNNRYKAINVAVGDVVVGDCSVVKLQSMTNTDTMDTDASVAQIMKVVDNGAHYVRLTTQGLKEAENLKVIKSKLLDFGYNVPLVADVHFNPKVAELAATICEKVRVNPGNYSNKSSKTTYSDAEYSAEIDTIETRIKPLLDICREHGTAIRIGTNHGSLSSRIVERYGDTPKGMVEATMEFLRICNKADFHNIVVSLKASNTRIMVYATRLLVDTMKAEGLCYPLHLGVTEAGGGDEGRIKSAVGIASLLIDGIGDTIRVSLTEAPEKEIPVADTIVSHVSNFYSNAENYGLNIYEYSRRISVQVKDVGGSKIPIVIGASEVVGGDVVPDYVWGESKIFNKQESINIYDLKSENIKSESIVRVDLNIQTNIKELVDRLNNVENVIVLLTVGAAEITKVREVINTLNNFGNDLPVIVQTTYEETDYEAFQIKAACDFGVLFLDGLIDGISLKNSNFSDEQSVEIAFQILQASRVRLSQTDYISCPGCGRTLFNLEETAKVIKARTSHLKHLKIGVMGCIVNGPGEMADADYGYVGSGKGKVNLYKGKTVIKKNVPSEDAVDELISIIKKFGDWV